jgi:hypothetical protein
MAKRKEKNSEALEAKRPVVVRRTHISNPNASASSSRSFQRVYVDDVPISL